MVNVADYVWVDLTPHSSSCERFAQQDDLQVRTSMAELERTAWTYSSCKTNSIQHFYTDITDHEQANNLAVEVEDIETSTDPESLLVMLFQGDVGDEPPQDPNVRGKRPPIATCRLLPDICLDIACDHRSTMLTLAWAVLLVRTMRST